ncbi:MAG: hypothetical protein R6V58_14810 [Planctomycetota bacterium]
MTEERKANGGRAIAAWVAVVLSLILIVLAILNSPLTQRQLEAQGIQTWVDMWPGLLRVGALLLGGLGIIWLTYWRRAWLTRSPYWAFALLKRARAGLFMHRRLIAAELLTRGYSPALRELQIAEWHKKTTPLASFWYDPASLPRRHNDWSRAQLDQDCNASNNQCLAYDEAERWSIIGPYIRLPRKGRYLTVFRVRLRREDAEGKHLVFDVTHRSKPHSARAFHCAARVWRGADKQYEAVAIFFGYNGEEQIEFRVNPDVRRTSDPPQVAIDCISVLYLGK